jgi:hypothetical protein
MMIPLTKNIDEPRSKYLVFTSAGDNANIHHWQKGHRNFDLWISYYGDSDQRFKDRSDFYIAKKGGKFPNLHYIYQHWKDILDHYQAVLVMDDDIIIDGSGISRLFEIREQHDLWLLQPAFDPRGKISHGVTQVKPFTLMRYTNFVEVTCPLFKTDKLFDFLEVYDPSLVGWGVDWWYSSFLEPDIKGKASIVDEITCINPHNKAKGRGREIDRLQDTPTRIMNWERIKEQRNIKVSRIMQFGSVKSPLSVSSVTNGMAVWAIQVTFKWVGLIKKATWRLTRRLTH